MKKNYYLYCIFVLSILLYGCDTNDLPEMTTTCNTEGGVLISDQIGRIYKWTADSPDFYYIGNPIPVSSGVNGGYISCNDLPRELQKEGTIVEFSGIDKGSLPDTGDPLFAFIILSKIEKLE
jgi:hypothetical protein